MNYTVDQLLNVLNTINLNTNPYWEVRDLVCRVSQRMGIIEVTLYPGKRVVRTVSNYLERGMSFNNVSQVSYRPAYQNTEYQRASIPKETMFYGSVLPEHYYSGIIYDQRLTGSTEAVKVIRKNLDGEEIVVYTTWVVTKPIKLCGIFFHQDYAKKNHYLQVLNSKFFKILSRLNKNKRETILASVYFSNQFAKQVNIHYDYIISACFTKEIMAHGLDGVFYPSVKMDGEGFNIAINPLTVDNSLELESIVECTVYKAGKNIVIDNDKMALVFKGQKSFNLSNVIPELHSKKEDIIKLLYPPV